jgi:hypothetical protein
MKLFRVMGLALAALLMLAAMLPVSAQDDAYPVLILPIDRAQFLPGAMFDFRVEVHAEAMPDNFEVSINGTPASDFFGAEPTEESWMFGSEENPTPSQSVIWRGVTLPEAGEFTVTVTAGSTTATAVWTAVSYTHLTLPTKA